MGKKRVALHLDFFLVTLTYLNVIAFELFAVLTGMQLWGKLNKNGRS